MTVGTDQIDLARKKNAIIEKSRLRAEGEARPNRIKDAALRRVQAEVGAPVEKEAHAALENQARRWGKLDADIRGEAGHEKIREVRIVDNKFTCLQDISDFQDKAWHKLAGTHEGNSLIKQVGGKDRLIEMGNARGQDYLTRVATLCGKAGLDESATGRNVHRMHELHVLEKHPQDVLVGREEVELRINYCGPDGKNAYVELDDVKHLRDGSHSIEDYKPINLSHFERTTAGKAWAGWAEKAVGPGFREQIQAGKSPFFNYETHNSMPASIRAGLREYLRDVKQSSTPQLQKYKELYSTGRGISPEKVRTTVRPYFKFTHRT